MNRSIRIIRPNITADGVNESAILINSAFRSKPHFRSYKLNRYDWTER